jgi:hypothetical protein
MTHQDTTNVRLAEQDEDSYREYRGQLVRDFAADKVRAGAWSEDESGEGRGRATTTSSIR